MPELVLELNGQTWTLDRTRSYHLGRDPQADLVFQDSRVSWRHASVRWAGQGWVLEDNGSTNGTFSQGQRVQHLPLVPGTVVHLGNATDGPRITCSAPAAQQAPPAYQQPPAAYAQPPAYPQQQPAAYPQQPAAYPQGTPSHQFPQAQHAQQAPHTPAMPAAAPASPVPPSGPPGGAPGAGAPAGFGGGPADRGATSLHRIAVGKVTRIGRALENELVVSDLQVSRLHAEFLAHPDGRFEIRDMGSHNGTYVNGQQLPKNGHRYLGQNDTVGIGHSTFRLVGGQLQEFVDTGEVSFSARHLTVKVNNGQLTILNDVSFGVPEKSLIGVIGPSGSGKSTLLRALTGYRPATYGEVLYDHRNLYTHFAELRHRIGLVPQDDILHTALPIRQALRLAAQLRFPGDVAEAERNARVEEVLAELKLSHHATKRISSLSGGQRKRVSVALELLTKPSLIFLDEPTSGLDPGMDRDVMQLLRGLADDGRTVLVVTHSVAELDLCDRVLVMAPGGGVAYFGPPKEALNFFGYETWADVFSAFENYRDYDWMGRWRGSQHYQMYAADLDAVQPQAAQFQPMAAMQQKAQSWGSQVWTLMRRYAAVIVADRGFLGLTVALPIVLGAVSAFIPADYGLGYGPQDRGFRNGDASMVLLILVVGMCFSGAANAVRELIKERVIYERERAVGLSRSAYLMSKVFVLGIVTVLQAAILSIIGFAPRDMPVEGVIVEDSPALEMTVVLMALGCTSMMLGLVISALVRTSEMTMPLLVMISVIQLVFTGALFKVHGSLGVEQLSWLMPSRWALAGVGTTADLNTLTASPEEPDPDPIWKHEAGYWLLDMLMLGLLAVICGYLVMKFLRRHEPEVMRN
ncbi:FHA domain-containing protein [Streptomyces hoynatensis]|uniref:FHA domain-containing protein n=1 Tax=Streptomyces hoynatensis TaxID=1141874 RepID=A0A3A9Z218_9ACTN|nr:FHA domain-containing protein [Streptomyces hoynatensis]RKN42482.1 FHA domain-containing protein [Streptomyces hoynatensis]